MDQNTALKCVTLLKQYAESSDTLSFEGAETLAGFHTWADGKPNHGLFRAVVGERTFWLLFCQWAPDTKPKRYHLVLYPEPKTGPLMELHKVSKGALEWRYKPAKRDGRNDERKRAFEAAAGGLVLSIRLPVNVEGVPSFVDSLVQAIDTRLAADGEVGTAEPHTEDGELPSTFTMTWNPTHWSWSHEDIAEQIAQLETGKRSVIRWSTGVTKRIKTGDRVVFLRLGEEPRGVFGSGRVVSDHYTAAHWSPDRAKKGDKNIVVDVEFDELFNPELIPPLSQDVLNETLPKCNWSPQGSGTRVPSEAVATLQALWQGHLDKHGQRLRMVGDVSQLRDSMDTFRAVFEAGDERTKFAMWNPNYFVTTQESLAPSKWAAFHGMTPEIYSALQDKQRETPGFRGFDGTRAYTHLERMLGTEHVADAAKTVALRETFERIFGPESVRNVNHERVKFLQVPDRDQESPSSSARSAAPRANTGMEFESILKALESHGLHFSSEVVANFLLALQAKRFVIFTGISGTGKTRLALEVAKHFSGGAIERIDTEPEDSWDVEVRPYMLKHRRIVVPSDLAMQFLAEVEPSKNGRLTVRVGASNAELDSQAYHTRPPTNLLQLLFSGEVRQWFQSNFEVGDIVRLQREEVGAADSILHLSKPEAPARPVSQYEVIPVRPGWTDHHGLLGFYNALTQQYVTTPFLELLVRAHEEEARAKAEDRDPRPFFAILDEMNLARVERYFSDFLSAMESGEAIPLHNELSLEEGETEQGIAIPRRLKVPANVFFVGTVNVDETTYQFSPKVLDRAFTLEFNEVNLETYGSAAGDRPKGSFGLTRFDGTLSGALPSPKDWDELAKLAGGELRQQVIDINAILTDEHRHFGYRVANEIGRFVLLAAQQTSGSEALRTALDLALLQKVLPKLHGTQQELEDLLHRLYAYAVKGVAEGVDIGPELAATEQTSTILPRFASKLRRMIRRLEQNGFTSFIE